MSYTPTDPSPFETNVSDLKGYKSLFYALTGIIFILIFIAFIAQILIYASPYIISRSFEKKIFAKTYKLAFQNSIQSKTLTTFAKKLSPQDDSTKIYIFNSNIKNAFCILGDNILISSELINTTKSENELAFILLHELGHSRFRHNLKNISIGFIFNTLLNSVGISNFTPTKLVTLNYSRKFESEADDFALEKLKTYYGHTKGAEDFFTQIENEKPDLNKKSKALFFTETYLSTHPTNKTRIEKIKKTQLNYGNKFALILKKDSKIFKNLDEELN